MAVTFLTNQDRAEFDQAVLGAAKQAEAAGKTAAAAIPAEEKGEPSGVASLDADGKVPTSQLPAMNFDTKGSAAAVQGNLDTHTKNVSNPHKTTAAQVLSGTENVATLTNIIKNLLAGGEISMVKSIQRGTITIASGSKTATATIKAVNMEKAVVIFAGAISKSASSVTYNAPGYYDSRVVLTNATTVTASRNWDSGEAEVSYQVLEFY